jgi:DNA-binding transcriptional regulator YiaG
MDPIEQLVAEVRTARAGFSPEEARRIRLTASISQARVADAMDVDRTTIARWESGDMRPRGEQWTRYQRLLAELQREVQSGATSLGA